MEEYTRAVRGVDTYVAVDPGDVFLHRNLLYIMQMREDGQMRYAKIVWTGWDEGQIPIPCVELTQEDIARFAEIMRLKYSREFSGQADEHLADLRKLALALAERP